MKQFPFFIFILFFSSQTTSTSIITRGVLSQVTGQAFSSSIKPLIIQENATTTITKPGSYIMAKDVSFTPTASMPLLRIQADNVDLNINAQTINITPGHESEYVINGIELEDNHFNITIRNGNISNITNAGILIGENCYNIQILNMNISQVPITGIKCLNNRNLTINNCSILGIPQATNNITGIDIQNTDNVKITNCSILNLKTTSFYDAYGIHVDGGVNYSLCHLQVNNQTGSLACGVCCKNLIGLKIYNCEFNRNIGLSNNAYGLCLESITSAKINESSANENKAHQNGYGVLLTNTCSYCSLENIYTTHNISTGTGDIYGIMFENGEHNLIKQCTSYGNKAGLSSSAICTGVMFNNEDESIITESFFNNNNGNAGYGYGIYLYNASNNIITNNTFSYNKGLQGGWGIAENINSTSCIFGNIGIINKTDNYSIPQPAGTFSTTERTVRKLHTLPDTTSRQNISIIPPNDFDPFE